MPVFETGTFNHSVTCPLPRLQRQVVEGYILFAPPRGVAAGNHFALRSTELRATRGHLSIAAPSTPSG